jgi:hypothetical protein
MNALFHTVPLPPESLLPLLGLASLVLWAGGSAQAVGAQDAPGSAMSLAWLLLQFGLRRADRTRGLRAQPQCRCAGRGHGWGRGWVGLALLATVTSLPELASGISAVAFVDAPNLAVGNALGACVVNLLFLVVVDALQRHQPMYREASATHLLSAGFGVVMLGFVALSLLTGTRAPSLLHVGIYSPLLLALYLLALKGSACARASGHGRRRALHAPVPGAGGRCATSGADSAWPRWWCWPRAAGCPRRPTDWRRRWACPAASSARC